MKRFKAPKPLGAHCSYPVRVTASEPQVFYSLFKKIDGLWVRDSTQQYATERMAWQVWRFRLMRAPLSLSIRPVTIAAPKAQGGSKCGHFSRPQVSFEDKVARFDYTQPVKNSVIAENYHYRPVR